MKTAAKYHNKSPEEIVHQYKQGLFAKRGLLILILFLYLVSNIRGIWRMGDGLADVLLRLLLLIVITYPINIWISGGFLSLNLILNQNCDPVTYFQVMRLLEKVHNRKRIALIIQINEASGLMWSGRFSEALSLTEPLCKCKMSDSYKLTLLNIRFNCYKKLKDLEGAMQVKREAEALVSTFTKVSMQKTGQELLNVMAASLALWQGDYETFRRMEEARSARYTAKLQKVVSAVCLVDVDLSQGEFRNARARLEYAVQDGGTLYVVEEARCMLAELTKKEQNVNDR